MALLIEMWDSKPGTAAFDGDAIMSYTIPELKYYIPYSLSQMPCININWVGFRVNTHQMGAWGWQVKCLKNISTQTFLVRFYHPIQLITFALKLDSLENLDEKSWDVEFMAMGGLKNKMPKPRFINELSADDIPALLEAITILQEPIYKKQLKETILPSADILEFKEFGGVI